MEDTVNVLQAAVLARVPVRAIYAAIDNGELASRTVQRRIRLNARDVEPWRDRHR